MKITRIGIIVALLAASTGIAWLFRSRHKAVVWALREKGEPTGHPIFVCLNPFRDRSAERTCEVALRAFRDGNIRAVEAALQGINQSSDIIDHERKNSLKKWKVSDVKAEGVTAVLSYDVMRLEGGESTPINISLKRNGDTWQIVGWESWY